MCSRFIQSCKKNPRLLFWLSSVGFWLVVLGSFLMFVDGAFISGTVMNCVGIVMLLTCMVVQIKIRKEIRNVIHPIISPPGNFGYPVDHTPRNPNEQQVIYTYRDTQGNTLVNAPSNNYSTTLPATQLQYAYNPNNTNQNIPPYPPSFPHNSTSQAPAVIDPSMQEVHPGVGHINPGYSSMEQATAPSTYPRSVSHDDWELNVINNAILASEKVEFYSPETDLPPSYESLNHGTKLENNS